MIYIKVSTNLVLKQCIEQSSQDFQAVRTRSESANSIYEDWVMNENHGVDIFSQMQYIAAELYRKIAQYVDSFSPSKDVISYDILPENCNANSTSLNIVTQQYFCNKLLAWWYQYRDADLASLYETRGNICADNIFSECLPRTGRLTPRYF